MDVLGGNTSAERITGQASSHEIIFTSMGIVVLDEIEFYSGKVLKDVIGGSGAYSKPPSTQYWHSKYTTAKPGERY